MYLFIDTISLKGMLILFEKNSIKAKKELNIYLNEFNSFLPELKKFLINNWTDFDILEGISVINWPGSFTWTRIISLVLNTIQFIKKIKIHEFDYFYFLEKQGKKYPMIIKANRQEYLIKENDSSLPVLRDVWNILDWKYNWIWNILDFENRNISLEWDLDYDYFIKNYTFAWTNLKTEPYYIKKPNIT